MKNFKEKSSPKNRKQQRKRIIIFVLALTILAAIVIVVLVNSASNGSSDVPELHGAWRYDEHTEYEFTGSGNGCMRIDGTDKYKFSYTVDGNTLKIDFELDYVTDCEYKFEVKNDRLTLIGGKGTANSGQEYQLERER